MVSKGRVRLIGSRVGNPCSWSNWVWWDRARKAVVAKLMNDNMLVGCQGGATRFAGMCINWMR